MDEWDDRNKAMRIKHVGRDSLKCPKPKSQHEGQPSISSCLERRRLMRCCQMGRLYPF